MKQIKVLVVDDSTLIRAKITSILSSDEGIKVVGAAKDGKEGVEKVRDLKPDIVTMDIEMPIMGGLEAIEEIMASSPVPILVVTSRGDAKTAFSALSKGALEVLSKADFAKKSSAEIISKIKLLSRVKVITHVGGVQSEWEKKRSPVKEIGSDKIIAIASSTGGPKALSIILPELPENLPCPVVIAQHISDGFIPGLVEWLNSVSKLTVKEGMDHEAMTAGTVYISPSEKHMEINKIKRIRLIEKKQSDIYNPSCNALLSSAAKVFGKNCTGIILTGMGDDGALGIKEIKDTGGLTIAQDEASSVVFGMPKVAIGYGCVDKVLPLEQIGTEINQLTRK